MMTMKWNSYKKGGPVKRQWHIGEPVPRFEGYVVTFEADLDELNCLLSAMHASSGNNKSVIYTKQQGLIPAVDEVD